MTVTPLHASRPLRSTDADEPNGVRWPSGLLPDTPPVRNAGTALDLALVRAMKVNRSAVERRIASLGGRRTVKKEWQAAWLLRAITCMDLTTLAGDDTPGNVRRLCAKARHPLRAEIIEALGEIHASVAAGATEIDIVITRAHVLTGNWQALYDEIRAFREACGEAHLKTILGVGELATLTNVARASQVAMMAGADFIKTSTGKETSNATLPVGLVMTRMIRDYGSRTGFEVGFKPAGGIRTAKQALDWLILMKEELGDRWLRPHLVRFGASGLLTDVERQLEHFVTGRYAAAHRQPMV